MAKYVWSAKDKSGQTVIKEVEAGNVEESKNLLTADGYSDFELKEEDVLAAVQAGFSQNPRFLGEEIKVTAEQRIKSRDNHPGTFLAVILNGINQTKGLFFLIFALAIYNGYRGHWTAVLLTVVAFLAWITFFICLAAPLIYYKKLIQAVDWYRWEEVLSLIETVKTAGRFSITKVPETELIRNRAKALVGLGRLNEGLKEFEPCEGRPDCPGWLYKLFIGGLYNLAKQYDKAIECNLASIAEKPTTTAYLDLANRYARYKRNPAKAREALAEADKLPLVDISRPFRIRCLGIIAYLEGDLVAARRDLETAIDLVDKAKGRPFRDGHLSVARAYLSCVLVKQGDLPAAKKSFALAKAYLIATGENELLAECRQLTGERE